MRALPVSLRSSVLSGGLPVAFLAYAVFSVADVSVKAVGTHLSAYESSFILTVTSIAVLPFLKARDETWRGMLRMTRPGLTLFRSTASTLAGIFSVIALINVPIAEAYALIFLAPILALVMSVALLSESVGWRRWTSVLAGIAGVIIVTRPGFRDIGVGHVAALAASLCVACSIVCLRLLGGRERPSTIYAWLTIVSLVVNFVLMLVYGWIMPNLLQLGLLTLSGVAGGAGQIFLMTATRRAPANQIAPVQYSQLGWAIVYGALFFAELPDVFTLLGLLFVALSGLFLIQRRPKEAVVVPGILP
jgi:drug/metabolite transporter (DMT)-like permease